MRLYMGPAKTLDGVHLGSHMKASGDPTCGPAGTLHGSTWDPTCWDPTWGPTRCLMRQGKPGFCEALNGKFAENKVRAERMEGARFQNMTPLCPRSELLVFMAIGT